MVQDGGKCLNLRSKELELLSFLPLANSVLKTATQAAAFIKARLDFGGTASLFTDCYSYMGVHMLPPMSPAHQARQVSGLQGKSV